MDISALLRRGASLQLTRTAGALQIMGECMNPENDQARRFVTA
jgi:hypothetical protein